MTRCCELTHNLHILTIWKGLIRNKLPASADVDAGSQSIEKVQLELGFFDRLRHLQLQVPQSVEKAQLKLDFFDRLTPGIHISGCREFVPY